MSASMYARRPPADNPEVNIDSDARYLISPKVFGQDGTVPDKTYISSHSPMHLYILGCRDASDDGSDQRRSLNSILEMIDVYGGVELEIRR